jgi:hypothetical protein
MSQTRPAFAPFRYVGARTLSLHDGTPGEMQGAIQRIALDRDQPTLDIRRKPRLHR